MPLSVAIASAKATIPHARKDKIIQLVKQETRTKTKTKPKKERDFFPDSIGQRIKHFRARHIDPFKSGIIPKNKNQ